MLEMFYIIAVIGNQPLFYFGKPHAYAGLIFLTPSFHLYVDVENNAIY
jgi:hypothetical protein